MSALIIKPPACIISGEISQLALVLAEKLQQNSCNVYFVPLKVSSINKQSINSTNTIRINDLDQNLSANYYFHFAPESVLNNKNDYQQHQELADKINQLAQNSKAKSVLISKDPGEFSFINNLEKQKFSKENISQHIQQLILLIESRTNTDKKQIQFILKDLISSPINQDSPTTLNNLFINLPQEINLTKKEHHILHPLDLESATEQIIKTTFTQTYSENPFQIIGNKQITLINAGLLIKSDYNQEKTQPPQIISSNQARQYTNLVFQKVYITPSKEPEQLIRKTLSWKIKNPTQTMVSKPKAPTKKLIKKPTTKETKSKKKLFKLNKNNKQKTKKISFVWYLAIGLFVLGLFTIPPIKLYYHSQKTIQKINQKNYQEAVKQLSKTNQTYLYSKPAVNTIYFISKLVYPKKKTDITNIKNSLDELSGVVDRVDQAHTQSTQVFNQIILNQNGDIFTQINNLISSLEKIYHQLSLVQAKINSIDTSTYKNKRSEQIEKIKQNLKKTRKFLMDGITLLKQAPEILGKNSSKTYLTLFQNNSELRPTGGFIGSFALITFEKGKLLDIETFDVYSADGQLRGHVEPPPEIKKHLGEANWYLRDSNWNPDFPVTARRAEWFIDKELNRQVDGTISINLYVIKDLLDAVGEVEIPDYKETINSDNLFHRAEYFSELNYFDGSTQKRDFLSSLINAIFFKLTDDQTDLGLKTFSSIIRSANQSQLQMSFRNQQTESLIKDTIFSGSIKKPDCDSIQTPCITNYTSIIESNMGVNKVNYFIDRKITHKTTIKKDTINSKTTLTLTNNAETVAWPAGTYKNYLRFLIPQNTRVNQVTIDNQPVRAAELTIKPESTKKSVGLLVEIPINSQKTISVDYNLNQTPAKTGPFSYSFLFEKQSGTNNDPLEIIVNSTSTKLIPQTTNQGTISKQTTNFNTSNDQDRQIQIDFINN